MARIPRVVVPGVSHHVTQRGARRMRVFFRQEDYELYKLLLRERARSAGVIVRAYCLMPNHVHLLLIPEEALALGRLLRVVHSHYAELINARMGWTGHLWQQRFSSFPMDDQHVAAAIAYVHTNPVRAGLVTENAQWPWSSARLELASDGDDLVEAHWFEHVGAAADSWHSTHDFESLRRCSRTGRPLGHDEFVQQIEARLGRPLSPQRRGPKPKEDAGSPRVLGVGSDG